MTDVEVLKRYRGLMTEAMALQAHADAVTMIGTPGGSAGQALTGMPRGTNDPLAASLQKAQSYLDRLEITKRKLLDICGRFEQVIARILDDDDRAICRMYYGAGMTDEEIGEKISKERSTVTKRRDAVMEYLNNSQ